MLDLFCGRWGWSQAFAARGWECVGVDLIRPPHIPDGCEFIQADILSLDSIDGVCLRKKLCTQCHGTGNFYHRDEDGDFIACDDCGGEGELILGEMDFDFICASSPCEQFSVHGMKHFFPNPAYPALGIALFNHTRELCEASGVPYVMENVRAAEQFVGKAVHHCGPFYLWGNAVPPLMNGGVTKGFDHAQRRSASERKKSHPEFIPPELANCVAEYAERLYEEKARAAAENTGSYGF